MSSYVAARSDAGKFVGVSRDPDNRDWNAVQPTPVALADGASVRRKPKAFAALIALSNQMSALDQQKMMKAGGAYAWLNYPGLARQLGCTVNGAAVDGDDPDAG